MSQTGRLRKECIINTHCCKNVYVCYKPPLKYSSECCDVFCCTQLTWWLMFIGLHEYTLTNTQVDMAEAEQHLFQSLALKMGSKFVSTIKYPSKKTCWIDKEPTYSTMSKGCVEIKSQIVQKHSGTDETMTQEQRDNQLYYLPVQRYVVDKSK